MKDFIQNKNSFSISRFLLQNIFILTMTFFGCFFAFSEITSATGINPQISFQGKVVNTDGTNVTNGNYDFIFRLYSQQAPGGTVLWTETWNTGTSQVTVTDGVFQVNLGTHTAFPGSVNFNSENLYLSVEFTGNGEMTPRIRFTSVPYAFNADKIHGLTVSDTTGTLTIPNGKTIQFADAFSTAGAFPITLNASATTSIILPTTGTLATLTGEETLTNKTIGSTGLVFSSASTDINTASGEALTLQGNAASSFQTTAGIITFQPGGSGTASSVQVGAGGSGSSTPDLFGLDVRSSTGDPALGGFEGAMYYNTADDKFRCFQGSGWVDCALSDGDKGDITLSNSASVWNIDFTSTDGTGATSSASGLEEGTGGIGLLQGCMNGAVLKWNDASGVWACSNDDTPVVKTANQDATANNDTTLRNDNELKYAIDLFQKSKLNATLSP